MDQHDFEMPSPKRQRTVSPSPTIPALMQSQPVQSLTTNNAATKVDALEDVAGAQPHTDEDALRAAKTLPEKQKPDGADMLDFLMQHVEAESESREPDVQNDVILHPQDAEAHQSSTADANTQHDVEMQEESQSAGLAKDKDGIIQEPVEPSTVEKNAEKSSLWPPPGLEAASDAALEQLKEAAQTNSLPPSADTLAQGHIPSATEPVNEKANSDGISNLQPGYIEREWETDSSFDSSDSSDTSSDSDDESDDDEADEYRLLDPYEQARILMAEDGGGGGGDSDDEGTSRPAKGTAGGAGLRTINEKVEDILPKPNITITEDTKVQELGIVEAVIEQTVLIKAKVSGEYQVLETGSALCLSPPTLTIVGAIAETLGRVQQPLYTVNFASVSDMHETFGLTQDQKVEDIKGTKIYYVEGHSTFVFTQPLKAAKGTDASNIHDEEAGDDDMEFSDDEAEAEYKRQRKLQRKGIDPNTVQPGSRGGRGGRGQRGGRGRGGYSMHNMPETVATSSYPYADSNVEINYDDVEEGQANHEYTPLRRPGATTNTQMSTSTHIPPQSQTSRGNFNQNRGRGNRGGNRGRGRGNHQTQNQHRTNNNYSPSSSSSMYANAQHQTLPQQYYSNVSHEQQQQPPYFGFQPPPNAPFIQPSSGPYAQNGTMPPSPMTPLPNPYGGNVQDQWAQYHANQAQQYAQQQAQYGGAQNVNAEALAQVQRQLEELRRHGLGRGS